MPEANTGDVELIGLDVRVVPEKERCATEMIGAVLNDAEATASVDTLTDVEAGRVEGHPVMV